MRRWQRLRNAAELAADGFDRHLKQRHRARAQHQRLFRRREAGSAQTVAALLSCPLHRICWRMALTLSVLDLAPIVEGSTPAVALHNSLDLARHAEKWDYRRFWLA